MNSQINKPNSIIQHEWTPQAEATHGTLKADIIVKTIGEVDPITGYVIKRKKPNNKSPIHSSYRISTQTSIRKSKNDGRRPSIGGFLANF